MSGALNYPIFEYPVLIREGHLDTFGHVNNATYLSLFEEARWQFITDNGYGLEQIRATGLGPTVVEIHLKYQREICLRQRIVIRSQLENYPSKVGTLRQWMTNEQGEICCDASIKFGLFDTRARKLVTPTTGWSQAIGLEPLKSKGV